LNVLVKEKRDITDYSFSSGGRGHASELQTQPIRYFSNPTLLAQRAAAIDADMQLIHLVLVERIIQ
jgi:hypothetical protein